jgi:hypothetical protein
MDLLVHQDRMESLVSQELQGNVVIPAVLVPADNQDHQVLLEVVVREGHKVLWGQTAIVDR